MNKPENGLYMAKVTDNDTTVLHADEDAVCDAQTSKLFQSRDQNRADDEQNSADKKREADELACKAARQSAKRKRRLWYMVKEVIGLFAAAALVCLTYCYGLYVAIAAVTGCVVAAVCRVTGYFETTKGGN